MYTVKFHDFAGRDRKCLCETGEEVVAIAEHIESVENTNTYTVSSGGESLMPDDFGQSPDMFHKWAL